MRVRMRWLYSVTWADGTVWEGDCVRWFNEGRQPGATYTRTRVRWLGPAWPCAACMHGAHA